MSENNKNFTTVQDVLDFLKVDTLSSLNNDQYAKFALILPQMSDELQSSCYKAFPDFHNSAVEITNQLRAVYTDLAKDNANIENRVIDTIQHMISQLDRQLEKTEFDKDRKQIMKAQKDLADIIIDFGKYAIKKKHRQQLGLIGAGTGIAALIAVLGGIAAITKALPKRKRF